MESVVVSFLAGRGELTGVPVLRELPSTYDGSSRVVVVFRAGGEFSVDDYLDRALVRVDTYGPDKASALDLTGTVRALIWLMPDTLLPGGVRVVDIAETRGPSWLRDPGYASAHRYTTRYQLPVRVTAAASG